mmetsp:Transcript_3425/g.7646  ORF Transcript_3425/g.7646 Transcript_3425/m.7646 type:complete len:225 (+) Transcript_3425:797-1471(+)
MPHGLEKGGQVVGKIEVVPIFATAYPRITACIDFSPLGSGVQGQWQKRRSPSTTLKGQHNVVVPDIFENRITGTVTESFYLSNLQQALCSPTWRFRPRELQVVTNNKSGSVRIFDDGQKVEEQGRVTKHLHITCVRGGQNQRTYTLSGKVFPQGHPALVTKAPNERCSPRRNFLRSKLEPNHRIPGRYQFHKLCVQHRRNSVHGIDLWVGRQHLVIIVYFVVWR